MKLSDRKNRTLLMLAELCGLPAVSDLYKEGLGILVNKWSDEDFAHAANIIIRSVKLYGRYPTPDQWLDNHPAAAVARHTASIKKSEFLERLTIKLEYSVNCDMNFLGDDVATNHREQLAYNAAGGSCGLFGLARSTSVATAVKRVADIYDDIQESEDTCAKIGINAHSGSALTLGDALKSITEKKDGNP